MCSSRWERPARGSSSSDEPVPIQNPSAADRPESMRSVTPRTPESSVVRRWASTLMSLVPLGIAVRAVARAPGPPAAAVAAVAVTARAAVATVAAGPAVAPRAAAVAAAGADGRELLDRLAGDLRVLRQAQADAAALTVD